MDLSFSALPRDLLITVNLINLYNASGSSSEIVAKSGSNARSVLSGSEVSDRSVL